MVSESYLRTLLVFLIWTPRAVSCVKSLYSESFMDADLRCMSIKSMLKTLKLKDLHNCCYLLL